MVGYFAFQWGRLFFSDGGLHTYVWRSAPWGALVLMGEGVLKKYWMGGGATPTMGNPETLY